MLNERELGGNGSSFRCLFTYWSHSLLFVVIGLCCYFDAGATTIIIIIIIIIRVITGCWWLQWRVVTEDLTVRRTSCATDLQGAACRNSAKREVQQMLRLRDTRAAKVQN